MQVVRGGGGRVGRRYSTTGRTSALYPGLSKKVLNERLRKLQHFRLIEREEFPGGRLPHVEYRLTIPGRKLARILRQIRALDEEMWFAGEKFRGGNGGTPHLTPILNSWASQDTLDFRAMQAIRPMIERVSLAQASQACAKMMRTEARSGIVVDFSFWESTGITSGSGCGQALKDRPTTTSPDIREA
jgi:HxlR-like helix-turn-helix